MSRYVLVLLFAVVGCGDKTLLEVEPELFTAEPTYFADIKPMFERYCVGCHDGFGEGPPRFGGVELDRYATAFGGRVKHSCVSTSPEISQLLDPTDEFLIRPIQLFNQEDPDVPCFGVERASMPPGTSDKLTPREQIILLRWLQTGAPQ
ncbi:MAG: hypothetical protein AAFX94_14905 [Myxococcota bacterium]